MTTASTTPRKKRSIGKILGIILAVLIIPLMVGYFVVTSAFFFKKVILPGAGESMNSTITVADAKISPFSQVILTKLEVKPNGKETLLKADEVRLRYSLRDIMGGKITVDEVLINSPVVTVVENADGSSNLDPISKASDGSQDNKPKKDDTKSKPLNLNIRNVALKNALVQQTKNLAGGGREVTEISNLNISLNQLMNGQPGKFEIAADVRVENVSSAGTTNSAPGSLRGKLGGAIDYKLTQDVLPEFVKGSLRFDVSDAKGQMADLAQLGATLNCDLTPSDIRELSLKFSQDGQALGALAVSGPFSFANLEGKLKVQLSSIDRHVLNLVGAASGIDFNSTVISSDNDLTISQKGNAVSINGQLTANKLSLTKKAEKQTSPVMEVQATYQLAVDQSAQSALIQKFNVNGTQNQQKILSASISKPMPISWGGTSSTPEDATLQLAITDLNLGDWKAFASEVAPSGKLNTTLNLLSQQDGKQLSLSVTSRIDNLSATLGSNQVSNANLEFTTKADIAEMKKVSLHSFTVQLGQGGESALRLNGSGVYDLETSDADLKTSLEGTLAQLFKLVVVPDVSATSGTVNFDGQMTQTKEVQTVKGNLVLANFSGIYADWPLDRFGAKFETDFEIKQQNLQIRKMSGDLQQAGQPGGAVEIKGHYNLEKETGAIEMKMTDLNQNTLRSFLAELLGENQLVTILINGNMTVDLRENGSGFKGNLDLKNFVARDPKKSQADAPLAARVQLDATKRGEVLDLKQFQVTLSPTPRAKNQLNITGQIDSSKTNAMKGNLLVQSDAFDVTPFYDLSAGKPQSAAGSAQTPQSSPAPANEEPEPMDLGIERLIAEINIRQFYLREIEIKDWRGTAKIEGNRVLLNPFEMTLNSAPIKINADLNLGVKGYAYNLLASFDKVPLEPLANSFMPETRSAYQGTIIAHANLKGAGMTGVNLKKTLTGNADLVFTNANIKVVGKKLKPFLNVVSLALQTPELTASPISWLASNLKFGEGNIDLQNFQMQSDAFTANTKGIIPIADVLTNSPIRKFPVNFGLGYSLATKARLTSANTLTNSAYVMLPGFLSAKGTLGEPKPEIDKAKLLGTVLEKFGGKIPGVDEKTGSLIQGLGGILSGKPTPNSTNQTTTTTNKPAGTNDTAVPATNSNQQLINGVLDLFNKKKKK